MNQQISPILVTLFLLLSGISTNTLLSSCSASDEASGPAYHIVLASDQAAYSDLNQIQQRIYDTFVRCLLLKDHQDLDKLSDELEALAQKQPQNLVRYWQSYLQYYSAIYYGANGQKDKSESTINQAIERLESLKGKNAEDYALLSLAQSYSIQFQSSFKAAMLSSRVKSNGEKALAIDPANLRAYYVLASNDYYTPEKYGGGTKAESYLLKALEQPDQAVENPYLPSWGRAEAYEMLIKFYIKKQEWEKAKTQYQAATQHFPDHYQINKLASQLVGH